MSYYGTPSTTPAQDAARVRKVIRSLGHNPKGMVRVRNTGFSTSIEVFAHGSVARDLEDALREIDHELSWPIDW